MRNKLNFYRINVRNVFLDNVYFKILLTFLDYKMRLLLLFVSFLSSALGNNVLDLLKRLSDYSEVKIVFEYFEFCFIIPYRNPVYMHCTLIKNYEIGCTVI